MKKFLLFLVVAMLTTVVRAEVGDTFTVGELKYTITSEEDHTVEVGVKSPKYSNIDIPPSVDYGSYSYSVTSIADDAFVDCGFHRITIPNSVTSIGERAFWNCRSLTSIEIPNSVNSIGVYAFCDCSGLTSVEIPNSVNSIGAYAFCDCSGLTSVEIPESVQSIEPAVFRDCGSLTSVTIPSSVTSIGDEAFAGCGSLTSVEIPGSVISIGARAFKDCIDLASVTIPGNVTSIEDEVFAGCGSLTSVTIPGNVTSIKDKAFSGCRRLTSVKIPESVEYIGQGAFKNCTDLASVTIPGNVTSIEDEVFAGCGSLTSVEIPGSVISIGARAFKDCTGLAWLIIPGNQTDTFIIESDAFTGCTSLFSVMFLPHDSEIVTNAFNGCSFLNKVAAYDSSLFETGIFKYVNAKWIIEEDETVDAEKGIIWSADNADCWLSGKYTGSLIIPDGMTQLTWLSFAECKDLTDVQLPATLEKIGSQSFMDTAVKEVVIPNRVTQVNEDAFQDTEFVKGAYPDAIASPFDESVVAIGYDAVDSNITDNFVYSRRGDKLHYAPFSITPDFEVPETVTEITDKAFYGCEALTRIVLPEKLSMLGESVWEDCLNITAVVCNNPEPVEADRDVFHVNVYKDATLYVPKGCKSKYESVKPWSYFYNISDEAGTGIDSAMPDAADAIDFMLPFSVYTLQGAMVAESLEPLPTGIYVVRQGNNVTKIIVK